MPDATERWVNRLNHLGRELDATAEIMHPGAWKDQLAEDIARWRKLARKV